MQQTLQTQKQAGMHHACLDTVLYPRIHIVSTTVAGGYSTIILSQAVWKRSWVGHDPAQSKTAADTSVANTGDTAWAQLLTARPRY